MFTGGKGFRSMAIYWGIPQARAKHSGSVNLKVRLSPDLGHPGSWFGGGGGGQGVLFARSNVWVDFYVRVNLTCTECHRVSATSLAEDQPSMYSTW